MIILFSALYFVNFLRKNISLNYMHIMIYDNNVIIQFFLLYIRSLCAH